MRFKLIGKGLDYFQRYVFVFLVTLCSETCVPNTVGILIVICSFSPKREARLLNIIQELKTYKKQLSAKIDEKKRHADHILSPAGTNLVHLDVYFVGTARQTDTDFFCSEQRYRFWFACR